MPKIFYRYPADTIPFSGISNVLRSSPGLDFCFDIYIEFHSKRFGGFEAYLSKQTNKQIFSHCNIIIIDVSKGF